MIDPASASTTASAATSIAFQLSVNTILQAGVALLIAMIGFFFTRMFDRLFERIEKLETQHTGLHGRVSTLEGTCAAQHHRRNGD